MNDVRLIDANRLLEVCKEAYHYEDSRGKLGYCIDAIKHAPTIDAQPVKRGKWEYQENMPFESCNVCGYRNYDPVYTPNFCPNCGADMRGE